MKESDNCLRIPKWETQELRRALWVKGMSPEWGMLSWKYPVEGTWVKKMKFNNMLLCFWVVGFFPNIYQVIYYHGFLYHLLKDE